MSDPEVPTLPKWFPNLSKESREVQMAHRLNYSVTQQHDQAIIELNNKVEALMAAQKAGSS